MTPPTFTNEQSPWARELYLHALSGIYPFLVDRADVLDQMILSIIRRRDRYIEAGLMGRTELPLHLERFGAGSNYAEGLRRAAPLESGSLHTVLFDVTTQFCEVMSMEIECVLYGEEVAVMLSDRMLSVAAPKLRAEVGLRLGLDEQLVGRIDPDGSVMVETLTVARREWSPAWRDQGLLRVVQQLEAMPPNEPGRLWVLIQVVTRSEPLALGVHLREFNLNAIYDSVQ